MSDYTPTTEEIIHKFATGATWQHQSYSVAEAEIRRWMAAHDAEVRAAALAEQRTEEWEYGTALLSQDGSVWDQFWHETREDAEQEIAADDESDHEGERIVLIRRTREVPAGPWLPVPEDANGADR